MNTYAQFNTRVAKNDVESFEGRAWARGTSPLSLSLSHSRGSLSFLFLSSFAIGKRPLLLLPLLSSISSILCRQFFPFFFPSREFKNRWTNERWGKMRGGEEGTRDGGKSAPPSKLIRP